MNVLDLFSGTGELGRAFEEALEWHGIASRTAAYCERERYPQGILLSRMLRGELDIAPISTDVCELSAEGLPAIDAIIGGFPCQDISLAGRGAGLDGERSGLFFEIVRLAGSLRPSLIGLENVPAITIRGGGRVIGSLAALGYDLRWGVMGADDFGGTHKRDRWWCLAYRQGGGLGELRGPREGAGQPGERGQGMAQPDQGGRGRWAHDAQGCQRYRQDAGRQQEERDAQRHSGQVAHTPSQGHQEPQQAGKDRGQGCRGPSPSAQRLGLPSRPPYPAQLDHWRDILRDHPQVEPALRGVAARLPHRNDRVRACGNGVDFICAREAFKILLGEIR